MCFFLNRFERNDLGEYSCIASNQIGKSVQSIRFYEDYNGWPAFNTYTSSDIQTNNNRLLPENLDKRFQILPGSSGLAACC